MKHKKPQRNFTLLTIKINNFDISVDAEINYEVRDDKKPCDSSNIYQFGSVIEIFGESIWPIEQANEKFQISVHGSEPRPNEFSLRLNDCHRRDEEGALMYRTVRGKEQPIYDIPKGLGLLNKASDDKDWYGWGWVSQQTTTDMISVLTLIEPLYLENHEMKEGGSRWIVGLSLQTINPANK